MFDLLDFVLGALQQLWDFFVQVIQWVVQQLVLVGNFLWNGLLGVLSYAWDFLKKGVSLFRSLWDNFFKKIWSAVLRAVQKAHAWLESKLAPIINFLKRVRAIYDRWFRYYVKPLLNFLQRIRKIIAIMRLLHIHILDGLDKQIAKIEGKITQAVLTVRGILNSLIDVVNLISDPLLILRRPTLVYSFRRIFHSLIKVFTGLPPGYFVPSPKKSAPRGTGALPFNFLPGDPGMNPLASTYLGNDGLPSGFSGFVPGIEPTDGVVDDLTLLDYFDDSLYPGPACPDDQVCWEQVFSTLTTRNPYG